MPDPKTIATISANGKIFKGWKSLSVRLAMGDAVRTFQFTCSDAKSEAAGLLPGTRCVIKLGGQTVLTGWITTRGFSYDAESHDVVIGGKALSLDVADSAMPIRPGDFKGYTAEQIVRGVMQDHGTDLVVKNAPPQWSKPHKFFTVNPGESALAFVERAVQMRGGFIWDDEQGRLVVGQGDPKAKPVADLVEGRNILRCTGKIDDQNVLSQWNTYGQQPSVDGNEFATRAAQGQVKDSMARPNRTSVTHMPNSGDADDAATFAGMLAARANWTEIQIEATVAGWFKPNGGLWELTENCTLYSPMALPGGVNKMTLGTQGIVFAQDDRGGTTTTLTLIRPEYMAPFGHAGVVSDGAGNIVSNQQPAQPMPPDYQAAPATAPAVTNPVA